MTTPSAVDFIHANLPAIYCASRRGDVLAGEIVRAWRDYGRDPNEVTAELLVNAVLAWQEAKV